MKVFHLMLSKGPAKDEIFVAASDLKHALDFVEANFSDWKLQMIIILEESFYIAVDEDDLI